MIAKHGDTRVVVTLEIPSDARTNMDRSSVVRENVEHRTSKAKVIKIEDAEGTCYATATFFRSRGRYTVDEVLEEPGYNSDPDEVSTEGIAYFLNRRVAELFGLKEIANGLFEQWDETGQKCLEIMYTDGKKHGLSRRWHSNGQILEEVMYVEGRMDGLYQVWHDNGQKMTEGTFVAGVHHGHFQMWYPNGQKSREATLIDGKTNGLHRTWYPNGQKMTEVSFVDGKRHGLCMVWHEDGRIYEKTPYVDDIRQPAGTLID